MDFILSLKGPGGGMDTELKITSCVQPEQSGIAISRNVKVSGEQVGVDTTEPEMPNDVHLTNPPSLLPPRMILYPLHDLHLCAGKNSQFFCFKILCIYS